MFTKKYFDYCKTKVFGPLREGKKTMKRILDQYSLPLQYDKAKKKVLQEILRLSLSRQKLFYVQQFYGQRLKFSKVYAQRLNFWPVLQLMVNPVETLFHSSY